MRALLACLGVGIVLALLVVSAPSPGRGESVPLHMVPRPALDAVERRFKNARIASADRERDSRGVVYEVAIRDAGKNVDVTVTAEGVIVLIKREVAASDLPEPVVKALGEAYPQATYHALESVTTVQGRQETLAYYEVDLVTARRTLVEVRVSPDGKILRGGDPPRGHVR